MYAQNAIFIHGMLEKEKMIDEYFYNMEMEKKYTKPPTVWELAQAFSDCRKCILSLEKRIENELKVYDKWIEKHWFNEMFKKTDPRYLILQDIKKFLNFTKPNKLKNNINKEKAKSYPIQELYSFQNVKETSKRIQSKCPFHEEKNPSFYIFKDSNTFHCFSCGVRGDSINFIMKLRSLTFINAVKFLNGE